MADIELTIEPVGSIALEVNEPAAIPLGMGEPYIDGGVREFDGSYTVTPAADAQTIPVAHLKMAQDFVIGAIPSNYGLITWNGSALTVS